MNTASVAIEILLRPRARTTLSYLLSHARVQVNFQYLGIEIFGKRAILGRMQMFRVKRIDFAAG
jgi:hypothetical protein